MAKVTHRDAIAAIAAVHGLEIEQEWTGDYGRSREFAIGRGQSGDALELCCAHLRQMDIKAGVRFITNPESPLIGQTFLHVHSVPKEPPDSDGFNPRDVSILGGDPSL